MASSVGAKKGLLYKRFTFNIRDQKLEETFNEYLCELKKLIKGCEYKEQENAILRDRIVMGIKDKDIQEKLLELTEEDFSLNETIEYCRIATAAKQQVIIDAVKVKVEFKTEEEDVLKEEPEFVDCANSVDSDNDDGVLNGDVSKTPSIIRDKRDADYNDNDDTDSDYNEGGESTKSTSESNASDNEDVNSNEESDEDYVAPKKTKAAQKTCPECNKHFKSDKTLQNHMRKHDKTSPNKCEVCGKIFSFIHQLTEHMKLHTGEFEFYCEVCAKGYKKKSSLNIHMRTHTGEKPYNCSECGQDFKTHSTWKMHVTFHSYGDAPPYKCQVCDADFEQKCHLYNHERLKKCGESATGNGAFMCQICSKLFTTDGSLKRHLKLHSGEMSHECKSCQKSFPGLQDLKQHEFYVHKDRTNAQYYCHECGLCCYSKSKLTRHMMTHTGEKPFACSKCPRRFTQKTRLRYHEKAHTDPYECKECDRKFELHSLYKIHMQKHTGTLPFMCEICGKGFGIKSLFSAHMKRHTRELTHFCSDCGKGYPTQDGLKYHMKQHTGELKYFCMYCKDGFEIKTLCREHEATHLQKKEDDKPGEQYCDICKEDIPIKQFRYHMKKHNSKKKYACKHCPEAYSMMKLLKRHELEQHKDVKIYSNESVKIDKSKIPRPYHCSKCPKKFAQRHRLRYHEKAHDDPYCCHECNRTFEIHSLYQIHMQRHAGTLKYKCNECDRSFGQQSILTIHMKRHSSNLVAFCAECGKGYTTKDGLRYHMKSHTEKHKYFCVYCKEGFYYKSKCKEHEASHLQNSNERKPNEVCKECKQVVPIDKFKEHIRSHVQYSCKMCELRFNKLKQCKEHEASHLPHSTNSAQQHHNISLEQKNPSIMQHNPIQHTKSNIKNTPPRIHHTLPVNMQLTTPPMDYVPNYVEQFSAAPTNAYLHQT